MKIAMMQPTFLPWLGYFELIGKADKFIFLDDFQFVHRSYHQKNKLFVGKNRTDWYVVPVDKKNGFKSPLNTITIKEDSNWRVKLWKRIEYNYHKAPYYGYFCDEIRNIFLGKETNLVRQNINIINYFNNIFGFNTEFLYSSKMIYKGKRSEVIKNLLNQLNADTYLCAHGSFEYMYKDKIFPLNNVEVLFQDFVPKKYSQVGSKDFIPYLSILDAIFNVGVEETRELIYGGTEKWLKWNEMIEKEIMNVKYI